MKKRRLLILGPSFRRNRSNSSLPAIQRFDGLSFRIARKYLANVNDVDSVVMVDNLTLVDGFSELPYKEPKGKQWGGQTFPEKTIERARSVNRDFMAKKLEGNRYSEVFLAMGKKYAEAIPDLARSEVKTVFPATGGPGPKAQALRDWIKGQLSSKYQEK